MTDNQHADVDDATVQSRDAAESNLLKIDLTRAGSPVISADYAYGRLLSRYERFLKPVIDVVGAVILLVVTLPVMTLCALAVYIETGHPVLFRQARVGRFGRVFTMYKFRTMVQDRRESHIHFAGRDRRLTHKTPNDPRTTTVGAFLRKWSLDELPQFINVVLADMSLVGPRPELVDIVAQYEPWQHRRHAVKPGITGIWQTSRRGETLLHECTEVDIEYLDQLSLGMDIKILMLTVPAALGVRRGF